MALVSLQEVSLAFGGPLLFDRMNLQLEAGERVALLGRNGVGKTTLMKVIAGQIKVDAGDVVFQKGIQVTHLPQEVPTDITGNVFDLVLSGLGGREKHLDGWETDAQVEDVIAHMKLNPESNFEALSGGQKRRALLAKALVLKPEILLLDEPTNHLDIESIDWLEGFLKSYPGTLFFVTHDRTFMQHLAKRIIELDRGRIYSWACDYQTFLERKQATLDAEAAERAQFDKKLAQEEIWIRQGIKARRTRNEGRVVALERMREQKRAQRQVMGKVRMKVHEADRSGQLVTRAENLSYVYGDKVLIRNFSTEIMRGDKIGVIGANGSGKTTLLKILLDQLEPQQGSVRLGTNIQVSYYDQLREQLDENKTVAQNVCDSGDIVTVQGKNRHILGYLQDFLFSPERARTPAKVLSGGERNRLFLAKLFTRPSNLLVMDEPTNDLDVETLELLEELLVEYSGTVFLVSHDRTFLNNVVTSTIVLEGNGVVNEYPGGYDEWLRIREMREAEKARKKLPENLASPKKKKPEGKISPEEKRELAKIPAEIEKLETEQKKLFALMGDPSFYQRDSKEIAQTTAQADALARQLSQLYARWEQLETK